MRNQYKRDVNRLIQHPRARQQSRQLRNPGALSAVYSSASGLTRSAGTSVITRAIFEPSEFYMLSASTAGRTYWGEPLADEFGSPVNPPLGTAFGANPAWSMDPRDGRVEKGLSDDYGNRNWVGPEGEVVSWDGPPGRVFDYNYFAFDLSRTLPFPQWQQRWYTSGRIFKDLSVFLDLADHETLAGDQHIHGAAIHKDGAGTSWLYLVASPYWFSIGQEYRSYRIQLNSNGHPTGSLEQIHEFAPDGDIGHVSHWYFNQSGTKAVCTFRRYLKSNDMSLWALGRYDIETGFSYEVIWDRDNLTIGTSTRDFERVVEANTPEFDNHTTQEYTGVITIDEHLVPIYCDFKGDDELMVYTRMPQRLDSNTYSFQELHVSSAKGDPQNWRTSTQTRSEVPTRPQAIVTSEGDVLFEFPLPQEEHYSCAFSEDNIADTLTVDYSYQSSQADPRGAIGHLAIDARYQFVAVGYYWSEYEATVQGTLPYQRETPGSSRHAEFPATGSYLFKDQIDVWLDGREVGTLVLKEESGNVSVVRFGEGRIMPNPDYTPPGGGSDSFSDSSDIIPERAPIFANQQLLTAGGYTLGGKSVAGVALWPPFSDPVEGMFWSELDGYASVKRDLLGGSESDYRVLHRVGLY